MTSPLRPEDDPAGEAVFEFSGDITDYWSYTQVRDYVMLMPGITHTAYRFYSILRSMMIEAARRPRSGMRRMTIDQMCWLLPGPNDKPLSVSAMYDVLKTLEELNLVLPGDTLELEGASKLKGKAKAAMAIARGMRVMDLPPSARYTGWRNAWDKLDAYRPDWRENPPQPPTHITETTTEPNGQVLARVRLVGPDGEPFQKTGTALTEGAQAPLFQKTGTAFQNSGTVVQNSGTDLALTSGNGTPLRSSLSEASLSPATGAPAAPAVGAEEVTEEREMSASPEKTTPAPAAAAKSGNEEPARAVAETFAVQWKQVRGTRPNRRQLAAVAADAAEALEDGDSAEWLTESVIPFMVASGWLDLGRAKTHPKCPAPRGATLPGQRPSVPDWCGECNDGARPATAAERFRKVDGRLVRCPECHPGARQPAAV
ncbi:hypothetical protein ACFXC8_13295 [Streptomyces sp. NPDC059441]|uniref:hypothetical protein n=1 Tax=Streptomyces sp. NPDC059441 TaxID=3346829 RepID=UPI00368F3A60